MEVPNYTKKGGNLLMRIAAGEFSPSKAWARPPLPFEGKGWGEGKGIHLQGCRLRLSPE